MTSGELESEARSIARIDAKGIYCDKINELIYLMIKVCAKVDEIEEQESSIDNLDEKIDGLSDSIKILSDRIDDLEGEKID